MAKKKEQPLVPPPLSKVKLDDFDPEFTGGMTKEEALAEEDKLETELAELQNRLFASGQHALLVVLQAMDTGGKDGAIRKVFDTVNPQGVRVVSFKTPTVHELARDFLWRVHLSVPAKGTIGIFNRSHYEDVLIGRVARLAPRQVIDERYEHINAFERLLADTGTVVLKFYLHISKAEQRERLEARLADPHKQWKFSSGDLPVREQWEQYMKAYELALSRCNTDYAPWHIVPANKKWYRDLVITRTIVESLRGLNLQYPPAEEGLDQIVIPD